MITVSLGKAGAPEVAPVALWSAGFRPFFLLAAIWAALAVPLWPTAYVHGHAVLSTALAGCAWSAAFGLFAILYAPLLIGRKQ